MNEDLRRRIIEEAYRTNCGHVTPALSCVDSIKYLYDEIMGERDIFILSKGHGSLALHAVLETKGLPKDKLWTPMVLYDESLGLHATTGSLGHGLPIALGRAYAKQQKRDGGKVYCMSGDGEMEEGSVWEALGLADRLHVDNLVLLIDWNKYQAFGAVKDIWGIDSETLTRKLRAFGYNAMTIDGHDERDLSRMGTMIKTLEGKLNAFILNTVKGKGVSFLERDPDGIPPHVFYFNEETFRRAMEELK